MLEGQAPSEGRTVRSALVMDMLELEPQPTHILHITNPLLSHLHPDTWPTHLVSIYSLAPEEDFVKVYIFRI